jgi:hypothetical protein
MTDTEKHLANTQALMDIGVELGFIEFKFVGKDFVYKLKEGVDEGEFIEKTSHTIYPYPEVYDA